MSSNSRTISVASGRSASQASSVKRTTSRIEPGSGVMATRDLRKSYRKGGQEIPVLQGVNMTVDAGEFLAIIGQSGSGKSTLLHLLGTLDVPDSGEVFYDECRIDNISSKEKENLRNNAFGMIFQFYHLLPELSTLENVLLTSMISSSVWRYWKERKEAHERAKHVLGLVGMGHRLKHRPRELSGGEMQRVAIARALVNNPRLLLSDEPTGNLDQQTTGEIVDLLQSLNQDHNLTIVMVTHDLSLAERADRVIRLHEGRVQTAALGEPVVAGQTLSDQHVA